MALKLLGSLESSGGNVGIGTASPSSKLHIVTGTPTGAAAPSSDVPLLIDSNGNQFIEFRTRSAATGLMQGTLYSDNGKNAFIGYKEYTGAVANTYGESIHIALKNFTASDAGSGIYLGTTSDPTLGVTNPIMFLKGNGNVGIGTTSPGYPFSLENSGTGLISRIYNTNANGQGLLIRAGATTSATRAFQVASSNDTKIMTVNSNGKVGIGTASPTYKLQIGTTGGLADSIRIGDYTVAKDTRQYIGYTRNDTGLFESSGNGDTPSTVLAGVAGIRIVNTAGSVLATAADQSVQLLTHIYNGSSRVALHANFNGNVGIGTTSPNYKLDVNGEAQLGYINFEYSSNYAGVRWKDSGYNLRWKIGNDGPNGNWLYLYDYAMSSSAFTFKPNSDMLFTPGGNVGIGTASPATKLDVNGVITATSGTSTNWNTAYGWGNHAGLYANASHTHSASDITSGTLPNTRLNWNTNDTFTGTYSLLWNAANSLYTASWLQVRGSDDTLLTKNIVANGNVTGTNLMVSNWNTAYGWGNHGSVGYLTAATAATTYAPLASPAAPTNLSLSVVNDTVNVTFTASATSGIDSYFVFSSVAGGDYSLISMIAPDDFGATMSIIDNAFDATGTQAYRVYAVKNGIISADLTGSISYSVTSPLEPTNMSVVNLNTAFYVQWDAPSANARFVTAYNVYKHEHATESSLARSSATLIYSGNNYSYMYQISGNDNNNFHKFWVETTVV